MKTQRYIILIIALLLGRAGVGYSQDFSRLAERSIMGTARYMGMGGAMSAIGGDPSSAHDNPAGLGLYRRMETLFTLGGTVNGRFMAPQASLVICAGRFPEIEKGVLFHNFMFSYRRLQSYDRSMLATGADGASLGALLASYGVMPGMPYCKDNYNTTNALLIRERGAVNEFAFDWAMNISNTWYVGLGLQVQSFSLAADAEYKEVFARDSIDYFNRNTTALLFNGVGCSFSAGFIYRPTVWFRLGFGIQTNGMGSLTTGTAGTFAAQTDSLSFHYAVEDRWRERSLRLMPVHTSTSVAFQIGAYGLIALQYDFYHQHNQCQLHSLRAGLEVIPVMGMYINAGYACESPFRTVKQTEVAKMDAEFIRQDTYAMYPRIAHYASCAIGYRGTHMLIQAAYQYRWQRLDLYAHEMASPYDMQYGTHRIVVTIGWHQNY